MTDRETTPSASTPSGLARIPPVALAMVEIGAVFVVLALAWKARSVWPPLLISDSDTWGYLSPALTWLSGHGFRQEDGRDWLYPAMLAFFLKTTGSFGGILVWQRALGYCSGILMAVTWRGWASLIPGNRWIRLVVTLAGLLPMAIQLLNQQNILFEMSLRPEAVLPFAVYAQLACVMAYCKYRWQRPCARKSTTFGVASLVLAYACLVLKPSWYFACGTTSLPVLVGMFGRGVSLKTRLRTPSLGALLAWLLLSLPARIFLIPDGASRTLLPDALFCVHVQFIDRLFHERLAAMAESDPEKARLQTLLNVMESEVQNAAHDPHAYEKLGINADYLMHSPVFTAAIYAYAGSDREKFRSFCFASYESAALRYPVDYTKKIFDQFGHFIFPDPKTFVRDNIDLAQFYREATRSYQAEWGQSLRPDLREIYLRYLADLAVQADSAGTLPKQPALRSFRKIYARWALATEILFLGALLVAVRWAPLRDLRLCGWAAFFLFLAPFGNAFGVCVVHTLDIFRYRATLGGYLLFALTALAVFIVLAIGRASGHFIGRPRSEA